ncbi:hypothetical protein FRB99_004189 [Tulasnella sp. 403]|nr:hypothetical protein FRB99_004189 [Tulasnella sp. 403]
MSERSTTATVQDNNVRHPTTHVNTQNYYGFVAAGNLQPLTHRPFEKAFTPIHAHPHPHHPPHMFAIQPTVYAVSRERTSNARADDNQDSLAPAFEQFITTPPLLNDIILTPEQAMEVDAARALEELSGRSLHPQHSPREAYPQIDHEEESTTTDDPDSATTTTSPTTTNGGYYRDPATRPAPPPRTQRSRKPRTGVPIPVPHLTKPSRGRRVPIAPSDVMILENGSDATVSPTGHGSPSTSRSGTTSPYGTRSSLSRTAKTLSGENRLSAADVVAKIAASSRAHVCKVEGCGKAFKRGEHLKRHVRSLHTHEKPERCTHPGCGKDFSRKDNMQQHLKIHAHNRHSSAAASTVSAAKRKATRSEEDDEEDDDGDDDDD